MSADDSILKQRRIQEERYFAEHEQELIHKLRRKAEEAAEREDMSETLGVVDEELMSELQKIGFTRDTVALLHLVPLIQLAWANDSVTSKERNAIVEAARVRGVKEGSAGDIKLGELLDRKPSDDFFSRTLKAIRGFVSALPERDQHATRMSIIECCTAVAKLSGGILGLGSKIDREEQVVLERLAAEFAREHKEEAEAFEKNLGA